MQMIRRRLVVRTITNPYSLRVPLRGDHIRRHRYILLNLCWYVTRVGNTWTCEMVAPRHVTANSGVSVWCIRFRSTLPVASKGQAAAWQYLSSK